MHKGRSEDVLKDEIAKNNTEDSTPKGALIKGLSVVASDSSEKRSYIIKKVKQLTGLRSDEECRQRTE